MSTRARFALAIQRRLLNPILRRALEAGLPVPGLALLETTGRKSGQPRRTPVTNGLHGATFWVVSEQGGAADYVQNIAENPRVRVKVGGGWRQGTARITDDDPGQRLRHLNSRLNATVVRAVADDPVVVRIDLDP